MSLSPYYVVMFCSNNLLCRTTPARIELAFPPWKSGVLDRLDEGAIFFSGLCRIRTDAHRASTGCSSTWANSPYFPELIAAKSIVLSMWSHCSHSSLPFLPNKNGSPFYFQAPTKETMLLLASYPFMFAYSIHNHTSTRAVIWWSCY